MTPQFYQNKLDAQINPAGRKLLECILSKESNLCLSLDVTQSDRFLEIADAIGPYICLLKTHIDILEDFNWAFIEKLQQLAQKHHFLLFEDRKFADIGHTAALQYRKGIYRIAEWAHLSNAHLLPGEGIIEGLKAEGLPQGNGLLLLAEMSARDNLIDAKYTAATLQAAEKHADFVVGFIAQKKLCSHPALLYLTPGVHVASSGDALGQSYISPKQAILINQSDVIIVGRGIYQATNPTAEAQMYREQAWSAAMARIHEQ